MVIQTLIAVALNLISSQPIVYEAPFTPIAVVSERELDKTLEAIIECESNGQPGAINLNRNGTRDWGELQINDVHRERMADMGMDIENPNHSFSYGLMLYEEQGVKPWSSSRKCWQKML